MSGRVAILGATGMVGTTALRLLQEREVPCDDVRLLASERDDFRTLEFRGSPHPVVPVSDDAFDGVDWALFMCANPVSTHWAPRAIAAGASVIDNSSAFRYDDAVPLVVPEVNGELLEARPSLVANPNCSTIAIVLALWPLHRAAGLEKVVVATYQSVSGAGREASAELERGIRAGLDGDPPPRSDGSAAFAFNVVPHIDRFEANGYTREEMKITWECRKILSLPGLAVSATAVRVPVRVGHSAAIHARFSRELDPDEARALWAATPGIVVEDDPLARRYPTPLAASGRDEVFVGRARKDLAESRTLAFFVASDNLRKGAATNAIQIMEAMMRVAAAR